ncbi:MAG: hypothetical protein JJU29_06735 [Verrucomicrobia bacterium]|nr:hypothetical protein [Verrucomicrobiota bacterium]MCH8511570.1 hypothetical protein [Kiritimatiellia bacterium]
MNYKISFFRIAIFLCLLPFHSVVCGEEASNTTIGGVLLPQSGLQTDPPAAAAWAADTRAAGEHLLRANADWRAGRFTDALEGYSHTMTLAEKMPAPATAAREMHRGLLDEAIAGRAGMLARLGRRAELETLLEEIGDRKLTGRAGQELRNAREGLHFMRVRPDIAFLCGPTALQTLHRREHGRHHPQLLDARSTARGVSLAALVDLAAESGMALQAARRDPGAVILVPAVVHWKLDHYAALTETRGGRHHIEDPTFVENFWMDVETLDAEASGYFLVPAGPLPKGWHSVPPDEAAEIWGKGFVQARDTSTTRRSDQQTPQNNSCGFGMAVYSAHLHMVSLNLNDIPVAYSPAYGPEIAFEVNYVERDLSQPFTPTHGHLGPQWLHAYHSFVDVTFQPSIQGHEVVLSLPGGGFEQHEFSETHPTRQPGPFIDSEYMESSIQTADGGRLRAVYFSINGAPWELFEYRRIHPDGTQLTYTALVEENIRVYMSRIWGPELDKAQISLGYAEIPPSSEIPFGARRLETLTDAEGGVSQVLYSDRLGDFPQLNLTPTTTDPLRIIGFLDPAGRLAEFRYDTEGRLVEILDAEGIASAFTYEDLGDQIDSLTTPYGTSQFRRGGPIPGEPNLLGWLEIEDALGRVERLEYTQNAPGISSVESERPDETVILLRPSQTHQFRNTFYWDQQLSAKHPGDYSMAHVYHWLHVDGIITSTGTLESYKAPLENRVYYNYPGMTEPGDATLADSATLFFPSKIARLGEEGGTWLEETDYNESANPTRIVDADGREYVFTYAAAVPGLVPTDVRPVTVVQSGKELLRYTYGNGNLPLLPTQVHRAGEEPITFAYNSVGQVRTVTQGGDVFTYIYDQPDGANTKGRLLEIRAPGGSPLVTYTWDGANRVASVTDSLGHVTSYTYDNLDRILTVTHPDGSEESFGYGGRLFPETHLDRLGRLTTWEYNAAGQLVAETSYGEPTEAALQGVGALTTRYEWCDCGSLSALVDPAGNRTRWEHDALGRVVRKTDAAGRETAYGYSPRLGRLQSVTRPDGVVQTLAHSPGGDLLSVDFSDGTTPGLRYVYDPDHGWLTSVSTVTSGTESVLESVAYSYYPYTTSVTTAAVGAGLLKSETGSLANSRVEYVYDNRGRLVSQTLRDDALVLLEQRQWTLDALDRVTQAQDGLGLQTYSYQGVSGRVTQRTLPGSFVESYGYNLPAAGGRMTALSRRIGAADPFTAYSYAYRDNDQLETIGLARTGLPNQAQSLKYDNQLRLRDAIKTTVGEPDARFEYIHDNAGNRVSAQEPSRTAHWQADTANLLQAQTALGLRRVVGTVDKPSQVKVNGVFVPVDENLRFETFVDTMESRNVTIEATDFSENVTTKSYRFAEPQNTAGAILRHDANGRLIEVERAEEIVTYTWDALDRLLKAERMALSGSEGKRNTYSYDPLSRLNRIKTESWDGATWTDIGEAVYIYAGLDRLQKRNAINTTVLRSYYDDGFKEGENAYYYGRDHLGSVTELIDASTGDVVSRREYSPYGEILSEIGTVFADFAFTGHFYDPVFALHHAPARVYDASLGRWLTPDPYPDAELLPEGSNLYAYVGNDPVNFIDPLGLCRQSNNNRRKGGNVGQGGGSGTGGGNGPPRRGSSSAGAPSPGDGGGPRTKPTGNDLDQAALQKALMQQLGAGRQFQKKITGYVPKLPPRNYAGTEMVNIRGLRPPPQKLVADMHKVTRSAPFEWGKYNPIILQRLRDGGLQIQEGMTRVRLAEMAGLERLPAIIINR